MFSGVETFGQHLIDFRIYSFKNKPHISEGTEYIKDKPTTVINMTTAATFLKRRLSYWLSLFTSVLSQIALLFHFILANLNWAFG